MIDFSISQLYELAVDGTDSQAVLAIRAAVFLGKLESSLDSCAGFVDVDSTIYWMEGGLFLEKQLSN